MNSPTSTSVDTTESIGNLLEHARFLRRLAERLGLLSALLLLDLAGDDTWQGPRPDLCRRTLVQNFRQVRRQIDLLLETARRLESRAEIAQTTIRLGAL